MEEERRAVDFYLGHGRQISYTLRVMGYSSRQKLMEWIDELAPGERINHEGYLRREKHPAMKKKVDCVMRLATRPGSAEEAAMEAGVSRSSLYVWKRELLDDINHYHGQEKSEGGGRTSHYKQHIRGGRDHCRIQAKHSLAGREEPGAGGAQA